MQLIGEQLSIERGARVVVHGVSFAVEAGRALLLTGANGAGKTTLLRAIAGFLPMASGELRLVGSDPDIPIGEYCHVIGHGNGLRSQMTVAENVGFWARYLASSDRSEADIAVATEGALRDFALEPLAAFSVAELSAGQKRRTGLARLSAAARPLWLLDEPTASLDSAAAELLVKAVRRHLETGGLAVIATHLPLDLPHAKELNLSASSSAIANATAVT